MALACASTAPLCAQTASVALINAPATRFTAIDLSNGPAAMRVVDDPKMSAGSGAGANEGAGGRASAGAGGSVNAANGGGANAGVGGSAGAGAGFGASAGSSAGPAIPLGTTVVPFGARGTLQFNIFGDYANDLDGNSMAGAQFGMSWFFVDNLSLDLQLEQYGIFQDGGDAYAIGPAMLFRWHFLARETWSLYGDFGCGFIVSTQSVPIEGSQFNFTPRAGVGASFEVWQRARVMAGVRWYHISNANTSTPNPGRNSVELYAGLSLPF